MLTVVQHAPNDSEDRAFLQPSNGFISTLRTDHPSHIGISPGQFGKHEGALGNGRLDSTSTLPADSTMDFLDWFSDFNDISSSWMPIDDKNHDCAAMAVIDPGTVGDLFHSSFNTGSVMDDSVQSSIFNTSVEGFIM